MARSKGPDEQLDITSDDRTGLVRVLAEVTAAGHGWINVRPVLDPDELPERPSITSAIFSAKAPLPLPVGTWVPGPLDRDGRPGPGSLGVAHPVGKKVATRLVDAGLRPPADWRGVQDNPRRGLVVEVPPGTDAGTIVDWLLAAIDELSPVALAGDWRVDVHR